MIINKKYYSRYARRLAAFTFLLFVIRTNAQTKVDTTIIYSDTLIHSEDTVHTEEQAEVNIADQKENYFLNKAGQPQPDSLQPRQIPEKDLKKLQDDDAFWYANANIKKKVQEEERTSGGNLKWLNTLLWLIIIGGFAAFLMIYLANSNIHLFSRKNRSINESIEEEVETENIFAINYQREIDKAIKNGNYRLGVRLLFLRLLRKLSDKNIIQYKQGNTNFDYLLQVSPTAYYKDFFRITRNYEYSWYGQFVVSPETFTIIQKEVEDLENTLK